MPPKSGARSQGQLEGAQVCMQRGGGHVLGGAKRLGGAKYLYAAPFLLLESQTPTQNLHCRPPSSVGSTFFWRACRPAQFVTPPHTRPVDSPCPTSSSPAHASILDLHTISLWHPSQVHKRGRLTYFALLFVFVVFLLVEIIT